MNVLHLSRLLTTSPNCRVPAAICIRTFRPQDVTGWLALRSRTFAAETPSVRPWSEADFAREMTAKPWWRDEQTWLAVPTDAPTEIVGAVTLAWRKEIPILHWLMVDPACRRRGIGRSLIACAEIAAWKAGSREVHLETHRQWNSACECYQNLGYGAA